MRILSTAYGRLERLERLLTREIERLAERAERVVEAIMTDIHPPRPRGSNPPPPLWPLFAGYTADPGGEISSYTSPPGSAFIADRWSHYISYVLDPAADSACGSPTGTSSAVGTLGQRAVMYITWPSGDTPCPGEQGELFLDGYAQAWATGSLIEVNSLTLRQATGVNEIRLTTRRHGSTSDGWSGTAFDIIEPSDPYYGDCYKANDVWMEGEDTVPQRNISLVWGWVDGDDRHAAAQAAADAIAAGAWAGRTEHPEHGTIVHTAPIDAPPAGRWYWQALMWYPWCLRDPQDYPDVVPVTPDAFNGQSWLMRFVWLTLEVWLDSSGSEIYRIERNA